MAKQNYKIPFSSCCLCSESLGKDNEPIGFVQCGHCFHECCYLGYIQEEDYSVYGCTEAECPYCEETMTSCTRLFLEPGSTGYQEILPSDDHVTAHPPPICTICTICLRPLDVLYYHITKNPTDDVIGALDCGHCLHTACYFDYSDYKGDPDLLECPICKTNSTEFTELDLRPWIYDPDEV